MQEAEQRTLSIAATLMAPLLAGNHPALAALRAQYAVATTGLPELSGAGFFLPLAVPPQTTKVSPPDFQLTDLAFELDGAPEGGSVVLFIRGGYLSMLEAYLWADDWPETPVLRTWSYLLETPRDHSPRAGPGYGLSPTAERDMAAVARAIAV